MIFASTILDAARRSARCIVTLKRMRAMIPRMQTTATNPVARLVSPRRLLRSKTCESWQYARHMYDDGTTQIPCYFWMLTNILISRLLSTGCASAFWGHHHLELLLLLVANQCGIGGSTQQHAVDCFRTTEMIIQIKPSIASSSE